MLAPWKKSYDQPTQHIKKQRHYFTNKGLVKAMVSPVVMYGCETWIIKKAEHQRIDAFELWCLRRFKSLLDCKEIQPVNPKRNQSWIFIGRTDAEAETPMLWPPDAKNWLITKDPDAGKDGRWRRRRDGWMASPTQWTWVWVSSWSWWWAGKPGVLQSMGSQRVGHAWATELIYLGVDLWPYDNCLTFWGIPRLFSKAATFSRTVY